MKQMTMNANEWIVAVHMTAFIVGFCMKNAKVKQSTAWRFIFSDLISFDLIA